MHIIITGATGMAGEEVLNQAIWDKDIDKITILVRRKITNENPKVHTVILNDFTNYAGLEDVFKSADACIWCLGISQTQVSKQQYEVITYDYTIAAANAMSFANPQMTFVFLSGQGADSKEKSRIIFARIKGKTENALKTMPFKKVFMARPGGIEPVNYKPQTLRKKIEIKGLKLMAFIAPALTITSVELAQALIHLAKKGATQQILENNDLKMLAQTAG